MNSAEPFETIVREHYEPLYRFALSLTPFRHQLNKTGNMPSHSSSALKRHCRFALPAYSKSVRLRVIGLGQVMILLAMFLCAGCGPKLESSKGNASTLPTAKVRVQTIESKLRASTEEVVGTVRAKTRATLEAKVSGRIAILPVVLGQPVKAGELVVRLDAPEIVARRDQAEASLQQAERDWKRIAAMFEQQVASRAEYEAAETRRRVAEGAAAEAKAMLGYVELVAPFDGVVTRKWVEAGDLATPGKPLLTLEAPSELQLEADVPEAMASHVHRESRLACRADDVSGELTGVVSEIAPNADPGSRTFRVKLDLPSTPGLRPGQFVRLQVPVGENRTLRVPATAVVQRGQLEIVFVAMNQHAQLRLAKSGRCFGNTVEILSGLDANDSVVVDGADRLSDGQPLETN
jgi:RND family efflux transporter MFP subunit